MVHVIDAIMGAGKTSAAINFIKQSPEKKFIYITPYLTEVERIKKECNFKEPVKWNQSAPKILDLKRLLEKGENIVTTHALFHFFDDEIIDICKALGYTLIMDEVTDVVQEYNIAQKDFELFLQCVDIDDDGIIHWNDDGQTIKYQDERRLCEMGCLAMYSGVAILWMFPVKIFQAFDESYILTYMFDAQIQKYYYDYYGIEYDYLYVEGDNISNYHFTDIPRTYHTKYEYKNLVNIIDDDKLNQIGKDQYALSSTWFKRNKDNALMSQLKANMYTVARNRKSAFRDNKPVLPTVKDIIWTTFIDYKKNVSGKGYAKGFLPLNIRATNDYKDRTVIGYMANRYFNPVIKNFFLSKGVEVNENAYAVSEMVQFIWRSAIREGKPITIYIPSSRMRKLLVSYLVALT